MDKVAINAEIDRQIQNLINKDYPGLAELSKKIFVEKIEQLKERLSHFSENINNPDEGKLQFVIVVTNSLINVKKRIEKIEYKGKSPIINLYPIEIERFIPIEQVDIPQDVYLLTEINRGEKYLNIRPQDALKDILKNKQTPLTIDEGIAVLTHFPEILVKNKCFSLLASRCGDQRVPAFWISANQAKLGWCWDGNPHTWLGSAFAKSRLGI